MSSLYELSSAYKLLQDQLEEATEDAKEQGIDVDSYYQDLFDTINGEFEVKAENYAEIIRNFNAEIKALKDEEERLNNKRKSIENSVKRLEKALFDEMKHTGKTNFEHGLFKFKIVNNGGKAPLKLKVREEDLPMMYKIVTAKPNNDLLRKLAENGENDLCYLGEKGQHLSIR